MKIVSWAKFHTLKPKAGDINASPLTPYVISSHYSCLFSTHSPHLPPIVWRRFQTLRVPCVRQHTFRVAACQRRGTRECCLQMGGRGGGDAEAPQSSRVGVVLRVPNYNPRLLQRLACLGASSLTESDDALPPKLSPPSPSRGVNLQGGLRLISPFKWAS